MSGFVATVTPDADVAAALQQMSRRISHRGDTETNSTFSDRCSAVGRHREQSGYRVDMYRSRNFAIVIDGLLTNLRSLREKSGARDDAQPAEVVLAGFEQHGESWIAELDGSFALMIIHLDTCETILARDRFGHRPLYFGIQDGNIWIGSEIKAILAAPGFRFQVNRDNLYSSIGYGMTPGPQTLFANIYKVVPGFTFKIDRQGRISTFDYFTPELELKPDLSIEDAKDVIINNLRTDIEHYLKECPSIATLLSGGVDSALTAHLVKELGATSPQALGFGADDWSADESAVAQETADRIGIPFNRCSVSHDDDLLRALRSVVAILEEPTRYENALALEILTREATRSCSAVITGEGADFILGEREHAVARRLSRVLRIPAPVRKVLAGFGLEKSSIAPLRTFGSYLGLSSLRDYGQKSSANCCDLVAGHEGPPHNEIVDILANCSADWPIEAQYSFMTLREAVHCWIERMEKTSAAAGLECFFPFESNAMFQFGLEMPSHARNAQGVDKPAVRSLAADIFGDEFAYREKKQLAAPMQLWLNQSAQLREAVLELRKPNSRMREYLDTAVVDKYLGIFEREGARSESVAVPVFRILTFEIWLETFS